MIPYFGWKTVRIGPLTLQVWGFFAALGIVLASAVAVRLAQRRGLDPAKIESLAFWTIVAAFVGARAFHVLAYEPAYYFAHPSEILQVWHGGLSSFGGFLGAGLAAVWQIRRQRLPFLKTADIAMPATVLGLGCGRIGCFLIHDHPGTLAYGLGRVLAVKYPDGPRYDLGLLLGLFDFLLLGVFLLLMRKPRKDGLYFALFMLVYGPVRFFLDFLRLLDVRYLGLTPGQYGAAALFIAGAVMMARVLRARTPSQA